MLLLIRIASGLAALVFGACWASLGTSKYQFDAYAGLAGIIFAISTVPSWISTGPQLTPHDENLFREFRTLFADRSWINLYRNHDFLSSFRREYVTPLNTVAEIWDDAAHSFTNKKLEEKRVAFVEAATELALAIAGKTIPKGEYVTVMPQDADPENLSDWVKQDAKDIDAKIPAFVQTHEDLLKLGNKLGANPKSVIPRTAAQYEAPPAIARTPESVFAYLQGNTRILDLTKALATRRHLDTRRADSETAWLNERLETFGIKTIRELDEYVDRYGEVAGRLSDYWSPQGAIDPSFLMGFIIDIAAIERGGLQGLKEYYQSFRYSSNGPGTAEYIYKIYTEVTSEGAGQGGWRSRR